MVKSRPQRGHRRVRVTKEQAAADAYKRPSKPLKNSLPFEVAVKLLGRVPSLSIALHCQLSSLPFDYEVDAVGSDRPLRLHSIPCRQCEITTCRASHDRNFLRIGVKQLRALLAQPFAGILHVFEEKSRRFYDLERLWRDAARVPVPPEQAGAEGSLRNEG